MHFSMDTQRSWVIRDFVDLTIQSKDRPELTARKIEQAVTRWVRKVDIPDRPVTDESSWRDYLERKTKELV